MEYGPGKNHEYHSDVFPDLPLDSECLMWHFCPSQPYGPIQEGAQLVAIATVVEVLGQP